MPGILRNHRFGAELFFGATSFFFMSIVLQSRVEKRQHVVLALLASARPEIFVTRTGRGKVVGDLCTAAMRLGQCGSKSYACAGDLCAGRVRQGEWISD